jgi:serine/threonine protein phosphatase 1
MTEHQPRSLERLARNRRGRDLIIGDIHGHFSRVERELARVGFDPARDRLICVGDLIDRGPESVLAAQWLELPWFHAVMGNHDASLLHRCGLLSAKFEMWLDHHGWFARLDAASQKRLRERLAALPWALEVPGAQGLVGIVHAEVPQAFSRWGEFVAALEDENVRAVASSGRTQARQALDWDDPHAAEQPMLGEVAWTIHGHTPRPGCRPGRLGNRLWIDTRGWYEQLPEHGTPCFTLLDVDDPLTPL